MRRRDFLAASAAASASLLLPRPLRAFAPRRVRGRVTGGGRGLAGVRVSDGRTVVRTGADGTFTLVADAHRPFVFASVPAGYALPTGPAGSLRHFRPMPERDDAALAFAFEPAPNDDRHAVLVLADPQIQNAFEMARFHAETVPDVVASVAALGGRPAFGVGCGDLMFDDLTLYPEYERGVARMGVPFAQVVGNHDLDYAARTDVGATATFRRTFGPPYYSFDRGEVRYVVLHDVFWTGGQYVGYVPEEQLAWLAADLDGLERGRAVVVFAHIPLVGTAWKREGRRTPDAANAVANREALYALLAPYRATVVAGHMHETDVATDEGVTELTAGAVCGAWWSGDVCHDGTPNGYLVVEATGADLRWTYKGTGRPLTHQLRAYAAGSDPAAPAELVANVWGWMGAGEVFVYEDGVRRGALARRTGLDPLARVLQTGPALPARRTWVEPTPTDHLFYAPAADLRGRVEVAFVDRWGREFRAVPEPLPAAP